MALSLSAEQRSIEQIFNTPENFVIPPYQRSYSWEYDQCSQLYCDLTDAFEENKKDYFIGNIIIAKSATERTNRYVVDGQQRLITIWLILRILSLLYPEMKILKKLTVTEGREEGEEDKLNINSKVFENADEKELIKIYRYTTIDEVEALYIGKCYKGKFIESRCDSRIEANAIWIYTWLKSFKEKDSLRCKEFITYILDQVFLLPIELTGDNIDDANNRALKIFETINNRGMNLEDADIFKAKLYEKADALNENEIFINQWQEFKGATDDLNMKVDEIFRYYSHIIRGHQGITSSEKNLRDLFIDSDFSPLITAHYSEVMSDLKKIIECLKYIEYKQSDLSELSKWIQVIKAYTNQYPMYAIVSFLFINGFENNIALEKLLKSIIRYVYYVGTTTTVKFEIYNIIKQICKSEDLSSYHVELNNNNKLYYHSRLRKGFALLSYYLQGGNVLSIYSQDKILVSKDINEKIFILEDNSTILECIDSIGNDIIIDKPKKYLDWTNKMKYYRTSEIEEVRSISKLSTKDDIVSLIKKRENKIQKVLNNYFFKN